MSKQAVLATKKFIGADHNERLEAFNNEMVEFTDCFYSDETKAVFENFAAKKKE